MGIEELYKRVRLVLVFFLAVLVVSGVTAFPLRWELTVLNNLFGQGTWVDDFWPAAAEWVSYVHRGLAETYDRYPFMAYGTDWLAFAHLVIGVAFMGALKEPVRNIWVVEFGMIACVLVIPLALICGQIRGIPFGWRLLDCSFGVFGIIPLWLARRDIQELAQLEAVST